MTLLEIIDFCNTILKTKFNLQRQPKAFLALFFAVGLISLVLSQLSFTPAPKPIQLQNLTGVYTGIVNDKLAILQIQPIDYQSNMLDYTLNIDRTFPIKGKTTFLNNKLHLDALGAVKAQSIDDNIVLLHPSNHFKLTKN